MKTHSYDPRIKQFFLDYFDCIGAEVERLSDDLIRVCIAEEHAEPFDGKTNVLLAFRFADMKNHDDAEFITFGSYTLDRVIQDCMARGNMLQRYIAADALPVDDAILEFPATIAGCVVSAGDSRRVYAPYLTFTFLICYSADTKVEEIASVTIDPRTRKPIADDEMAYIRSCPAGPEAEKSFLSFPNTEGALLTSARRHIEAQVAQRGAAFRRELESKLHKELQRLDEYYRDAIEETENSRRQNVAEELRRLEQEREIRICEETGRYTLSVNVRLLAVACRRYPIIERGYRISRDSISVDKQVGYDVRRRALVPLRCDVCEGALSAGALCEHGHLVCANCARTCAVCGKATCPEHGGECRTCEKTFCRDHLRTCHVCGGSFCMDHTAVCPDCGGVSCLAHRRTCSICRQAYCQGCFDSVDVCKTCSAALKTAASAPTSEIMDLSDAVGVRGEIESLDAWRVGDNKRFVVLLGERFFSRRVVVIDKESKRLAHAHKVGLIGKLFGRR
ncbi:MAG: hypothetical protein AB1696_24015 [Planctomycetota bacterium]